jgi:hypothetical protein
MPIRHGGISPFPSAKIRLSTMKTDENPENTMFSTIIRPSYYNAASINLPAAARRMLDSGQVVFTAGPDETPVFTGNLRKTHSDRSYKPIHCKAAFTETHPLLP